MYISQTGNDDHQAHDEFPEADVSRQSNSANKFYTSHNWSVHLAMALVVLIYKFKSR